ncbi:MAG: ABC transporter permease [Clostridia bacterium]|nr:ABC transporter permease [Clostridia bacterium]
MKTLTFAKRCAKEILRDPINLAFGLGFPIVLLLLLSAIQSNVPTPLFQIEKLSPGIAVFGLSFITLFSATLIAKDRESALLQRLYTTPLKPWDFILGYMLPLLPIALSQTTICYIVSVFLGLTITINILYAILAITPIAIFYIALGLLCGSVFNVKQVGGICGALLTNLSAWLSGVWFDLALVGGIFQKIANVLPFVHAVELQRAIINSSFANALPHFYIVLFYGIITTAGAVFAFLHQITKN